MLAKVYKPKLVTYPCYVQPKLNGVRALWLGDRLQSRSHGKVDASHWDPNVLPHIFESLNKLPNYAFDGELYCHGLRLQEINSRVRVTSKKPHKEAERISYNIFDLIVPEKGFEERHEILKDIESKLGAHLNLVETVYCHSKNFSDLCYHQWKGSGYEGMMYRTRTASYGFEHNCGNQENRWNCLLKRKERMDEDFICIGIEVSDGDKVIPQAHCASLQLQTEKGAVFNAGSGLTVSERIMFYDNPPVGNKVRVNFESYSAAGIPTQPSVELVYQ